MSIKTLTIQIKQISLTYLKQTLFTGGDHRWLPIEVLLGPVRSGVPTNGAKLQEQGGPSGEEDIVQRVHGICH